MKKMWMFVGIAAFCILPAEVSAQSHAHGHDCRIERISIQLQEIPLPPDPEDWGPLSGTIRIQVRFVHADGHILAPNRCPDQVSPFLQILALGDAQPWQLITDCYDKDCYVSIWQPAGWGRYQVHAWTVQGWSNWRWRLITAKKIFEVGR